MKNILFVLAILLLIPSAHAEIIKFDFTLDPDNRINLEDARTAFGIADEINNDYNYKIEILQDKKTVYSSSFPVTFYRFHSMQPEPVFISTRLPYTGNNGRIIIKLNERTLSSFDLRQLCNNDGKCDKFENSISCSGDCIVKDGLCVMEENNICDPDCINDIDCYKPSEDKRSFTLTILVMSSIFILLLLIIFILKKWHVLSS